MEVVDVALADGVSEQELWATAVLANDADIDEDGEGVGDPTEVAAKCGRAGRGGLAGAALGTSPPG
jgi:hypothetical protein